MTPASLTTPYLTAMGTALAAQAGAATLMLDMMSAQARGLADLLAPTARDGVSAPAARDDVSAPAARDDVSAPAARDDTLLLRQPPLADAAEDRRVADPASDAAAASAPSPAESDRDGDRPTEVNFVDAVVADMTPDQDRG